MPANVKIFLALNYLIVLIGVVYSAIHFEAMAAATRGGASAVLFVQCFVVVIMLTLVSLAGFGRQNWARWVLLVLFVIGLVPTLPALLTLRHAASQAVVVMLVQAVLQGAGLYFVFTGDARGWFRKSQWPD